MPLIHHPVLLREVEVSDDAAEIFTTCPLVPWVRGPLPPKPTAANPVPVGDNSTPSKED